MTAACSQAVLEHQKSGASTLLWPFMDWGREKGRERERVRETERDRKRESGINPVRRPIQAAITTAHTIQKDTVDLTLPKLPQQERPGSHYMRVIGIHLVCGGSHAGMILTTHGDIQSMCLTCPGHDGDHDGDRPRLPTLERCIACILHQIPEASIHTAPSSTAFSLHKTGPKPELLERISLKL